MIANGKKEIQILKAEQKEVDEYSDTWWDL
jgi:hypothetical protein